MKPVSRSTKLNAKTRKRRSGLGGTLLISAAALTAARRLFVAPFSLAGKSVLISGGSRGLGLALGRELLRYGANLTLLARDEAELRRAESDLRARAAALRQISGQTSQVQIVVGDVTQQADLERAVEAAISTYGHLDVVANVAGIIQSGPLDNVTEQEFRDSMEVNAFAPLRLTRTALPYLRASGGRVLIVASIAGKAAVPHLSSYSVSKFAAVGLGQALRAELAQDGVLVTTVCPGLMRTGSPRHAQIKGQHRREYALFATLDNLPLISLDADKAAQRIVQALIRGEAEVMIGGPAKLLRVFQSLAPQLSADVLTLLNRFLPGPASSDLALRGQQAETPLTRANPIKRKAERSLNES
ncbi:SDR family NAD(P)-dependent oxidoreductase [Deinococcus detaillensis]|uniref:SDR family NAD(P)-dependent oxidoreductase n=1 Tax=Deinococcus detaillensis TaxID=2592048 RepID=A0A553V080_9DEIO|nr:SDR family NAD(P)-dependent oxidoreductase [Deinococcus detaillensis]TSA85621.1 SDR family NAD(P)-dependent oxidoreductase [Deinococcus detaillensis]